MNPRVLAALFALVGCSGSPASLTPTASIPSASAVPSATPRIPAVGTTVQGELPMYPVAEIYSLLDVWATDAGIELRVGVDSVGGIPARFRFLPLVDGQPDLARETAFLGYNNVEALMNNNTLGGFLELFGERPHLLVHQAGMFRGTVIDTYHRLAGDGTWEPQDDLWSHEGPLGIGAQRWSNGRLLEMRGPPLVGTKLGDPVLPRLHLLEPSSGPVPTLPAGLATRLENESYILETFRILKTGEVVAVGQTTAPAGLGTVIWTTSLDAPSYAVNEVSLEEDAPIAILGGNSLEQLRLRAGVRVMKLDGERWVEESAIPAGGLPAVWFGAPLVLRTEEGDFAKLAADAPWRSIPRRKPKTAGDDDDDAHVSFAIDAHGTIYRTEDETLFSSVKPRGPVVVVTEEALVEQRKKSILRGGHTDATGEPVLGYMYGWACRMRYVLLHRAKGKDPGDGAYTPIAAALKGQTRFAGAKFIVTEEGGRVFFGASLADADAADALGAWTKKSLKDSPSEWLCAEPPVLREVKIDLATGRIAASP